MQLHPKPSLQPPFPFTLTLTFSLLRPKTGAILKLSDTPRKAIIDMSSHTPTSPLCSRQTTSHLDCCSSLLTGPCFHPSPCPGYCQGSGLDKADHATPLLKPKDFPLPSEEEQRVFPET